MFLYEVPKVERIKKFFFCFGIMLAYFFFVLELC